MDYQDPVVSCQYADLGAPVSGDQCAYLLSFCMDHEYVFRARYYGCPVNPPSDFDSFLDYVGGNYDSEKNYLVLFL